MVSLESSLLESQDSQIASDAGKFDISLSDLFSKKNKYVFSLGVILAMCQQLSGFNAIILYSNQIFSNNEVGKTGEEKARFGTLLYGIANFLFSFVGIFFLRVYGRKKLWLIGLSIMAVALACFVLFLAINIYYALIGAIIVSAFGFNIAVGPVVWIYLPEILPPKGLGIAVFFNWVIIVLISFLLL